MNEIKEMKEQHIEILENGDKYYYSDKEMTVRHREDGPAIENEDGTKCWYVDGKLHREDGPAFDWDGGSKAWYIDGNCHREDGPAIESANGTKKWYINGKLHREDGPAIEDANGTKKWYINGKKLTEEQFTDRNKTEFSLDERVMMSASLLSEQKKELRYN